MMLSAAHSHSKPIAFVYSICFALCSCARGSRLKRKILRLDRIACSNNEDRIILSGIIRSPADCCRDLCPFRKIRCRHHRRHARHRQ